MFYNGKKVTSTVIKYLPLLLLVFGLLLYLPSLKGEFIIDDITYFKNEVFSKLSPLDFEEIFFEVSPVFH